jgi:hypothetical protein
MTKEISSLLYKAGNSQPRAWLTEQRESDDSSGTSDAWRPRWITGASGKLDTTADRLA